MISLRITDTILKINDFSYVRQRHYNTQQTLSLCKSFVKEELPNQFDVSKVDQAALLNKSVQF
ncbi:MAG: nucleoid-associated protein, partial [Bacteroidales bacterium]|nr:nucleoid-associated protein [Bacteroidales bacterium]